MSNDDPRTVSHLVVLWQVLQIACLHPKQVLRLSKIQILIRNAFQAISSDMNLRSPDIHPGQPKARSKQPIKSETLFPTTFASTPSSSPPSMSTQPLLQRTAQKRIALPVRVEPKVSVPVVCMLQASLMPGLSTALKLHL